MPIQPFAPTRRENSRSKLVCFRPSFGSKVPRRDLVGQEGADLGAQRLGVGRQALLVEADGGLHCHSPEWWIGTHPTARS